MQNSIRPSCRWSSILAPAGLAMLIAPAPASSAQLVPISSGSNGASSARVATSAATTGCQPEWLPMFRSTGSSFGGVYGLTVFDDGSGPALYAATSDSVSVWDGTSAHVVGGNFAGSALSLAVFDDGGGPALYAGGFFSSAGGTTANNLAKWNGSSWSDVGGGVAGEVTALAVFDDGSGPALYAGGGFSTAGGVAASHIAKWNGANWSAVGAGADGEVDALRVFDDGSGLALFVGGSFTNAGGASAHFIAKWNGSSWSSLGSGMDKIVYSLAVFDDGNGPALYAGGTFRYAGGVAASRIAKWDGASWSPLGSGVTGFLYYTTVNSMAVFDDGSGPALYAGGAFTDAGDVSSRFVARWDGSTWSDLGNGISGNQFNAVNAVSVFDDGSGPALFVGGYFTSSPTGDHALAKYGNRPGCGAPGASICEPSSAGVIACPCGNAPASAGLGCDNSSNTGGASLAATGIARLSYDTVQFTTSGEKPTATSIVLQGDSASTTGVAFGQGVRCIGGSLERLYVKTAVAGSITAPQGADVSVHARSAALGDTIAPGTHRFYGVYYRDATVLGGCPAASTFNVTQQLNVLWSL